MEAGSKHSTCLFPVSIVAFISAAITVIHLLFISSAALDDVNDLPELYGSPFGRCQTPLDAQRPGQRSERRSDR